MTFMGADGLQYRYLGTSHAPINRRVYVRRRFGFAKETGHSHVLIQHEHQVRPTELASLIQFESKGLGLKYRKFKTRKSASVPIGENFRTIKDMEEISHRLAAGGWKTYLDFMVTQPPTYGESLQLDFTVDGLRIAPEVTPCPLLPHSRNT
jgi:hypothetical protein